MQHRPPALVVFQIGYSSLKQIYEKLPDGDLIDLEVNVVMSTEVMQYKVDDLKIRLVQNIWEAHAIKVYKRDFCLIAADNDEVRFSKTFHDIPTTFVGRFHIALTATGHFFCTIFSRNILNHRVKATGDTRWMV